MVTKTHTENQISPDFVMIIISAPFVNFLTEYIGPPNYVE